MDCEHLKDVHAWEREGSRASIPAGLAEHTATCNECASIVNDILGMRQAVASLSTLSLSNERSSQIREAIIARGIEAQKASLPEPAEPPPLAPVLDTRRSWLAMSAAAILLLGFGAGAHALFWRGETGPEVANSVPNVGTWIGEENANVERVSTGLDEVVLLRRGAAWFDVDPVQEGGRFRVVAGDGEVEVRGTRFRCDVEDGRLRSVRVAEGHVIVRIQGTEVASLRAGEQWTPEALDDSVSGSAQHVAEAAAGVAQSNAPTIEVAAPSVEDSPRERVGPHARTRRRPQWSRMSPLPSSAMGMRGQPGPDSPEIPIIAPRPFLDPEADSEVDSEVEPDMESRQLVDPANVDARFGEAWRLYRSQRFSAAARAFDRISSDRAMDGPRRAEILYWSARAHASDGRTDVSLSRARESLRLSPDGWWADDAQRLIERSTSE